MEWYNNFRIKDGSFIIVFEIVDLFIVELKVTPAGETYREET